jgi:small subunit ribosomal protein S6
MTILHPEVAEESLPAELDRIANTIAAAGGSVIESLRESPWGRRRLAYPIRSGGRDVRDGYYTVWHMNLGPNRVAELERELQLNPQLIRYLVVSWEPKPISEKELEAAEIAAEDAAAEAYAAAQAAAAEAAETETAVVPAEAETAIEPVAAEEAREELLAEAETAVETSMELAAQQIEAAELTAEAEALEATGAELAIEPVADVEEREELEAEAAAALATAEEAATAPTAGEDESEGEGDVPAGAVRGDGTADCPPDYPIKGNASSMLYHSPASPSYKRTVPEYCFATVDAAEAAGFKPTKYEAEQEASE